MRLPIRFSNTVMHLSSLPRFTIVIAMCLLSAHYLLTEATVFSKASGVALNPTAVENQQPGTDSWQLTNPGDDIAHQIKGFASTTSLNAGDEIDFFVSVTPAQTFTMEIYRMGWYGGSGGRLMQTIGPLNGVTQPDPTVDAETGLIVTPWSSVYTLRVPENWVSGVYVVKLTNAETYQNYIIFTVRNDEREAALLYQRPVTTDQAYNNYPHDYTVGKSLYVTDSFGEPTIAGTNQAVKVSFDRPYARDGSGRFFVWEHHLIRWLERNGYDVTYSTNIDTHSNGSSIQNFSGWLSAGHDEYWTKEMRDSVEAARDAGTNLAFFGANASYHQIRLEPSASGVANRIVVAYKRWSLDPIEDHSRKTVLWREIRFREEQRLVGVQYISYNAREGTNAPYVVKNSDHWVYQGTGFADGDSVAGIIGYEVDQRYTDVPLPEHQENTYTILSESPYLTAYKTTVTANSSIYQAPSGAWVFGSGTLSWSWGLDLPGVEDQRIQRTTKNLLDCFTNVDSSICSSRSAATATSTSTPGDVPATSTPTPSPTASNTASPTTTSTAPLETQTPIPSATATATPNSGINVRGRVTNERGDQLADILVTAHRKRKGSESGSGGWDFVQERQTGADGHYELVNLDAGTYRISFASADGLYHKEYHSNAFYADDAHEISLDADTQIQEVNAQLLPVSLNVPPRSRPDTMIVAEANTVTHLESGGNSLLNNDEDAEGDDLSAILVVEPAHGTLNLEADGTFVYIHDGSETTVDGFSYAASDGKDMSDPTFVSITVLPVNDPPVAEPDTLGVVRKGAVAALTSSRSVLENDRDGDNDPLTAILVEAPTAGTLTLDADGSFSYVPINDSAASDTFYYKASDGKAESNTVSVHVEIADSQGTSDSDDVSIYMPVFN